MAWGDYDNDGDLDLALAGRQALALYGCAVYRNDNGTLTNSGIAFPAGWTADDWGDFDNDGDLDLLFARYDENLGNQFTAIYTNNGSGGLTDSGVWLPGIADGSLQFGDYDSDGWLDILMTGASPLLGTNVTRVYHNNGNGTFTDTQSDLPALRNGRAVWGDYNNEGRPDVFTGGQMLTAPGGSAAIYRNLYPTTNTPPSAPGNPQQLVFANTATFRWDGAGDNETGVNALSYNLRVGTTPGGAEIMSPAAAPDGTRRIVALGNTGQRKIWTLTNLPPSGTFYWAVQAIAHSFAGSPFTAEQRVVIAGLPTTTVGGVSHLSLNTATLNGFVDANGFDTTAYFEWGVTTDYGNSTAPTNLAASAAYAPVSAALGALTPFTLYHWRMVASNSVGASISPDQTFISPDRALIASQSVTNVTATKATLSATVNPHTSATIVFFDFGPTPGFGYRTLATNIGSGTNLVSVASTLASLGPAAVYYYRPVASNAFGIVYGTDAAFTTVAPPYFTFIAVETNGSFRVEFNGASNLTYDVQVSTSLVNWSVLGPATPGTNGLFQYTDLVATNYPYRFYRVRSPKAGHAIRSACLLERPAFAALWAQRSWASSSR